MRFTTDETLGNGMSMRKTMGSRSLRTIYIGIAAVVALNCGAATALAIPPKVVASLEAARVGFRPITPSELEKWKGKIRKSADALESFLLAGSDEENTRLWKEYLQLDTALAQLDAEQPDLRALQRSTARFYQHESGLHLEPFTRLRDAMSTYLTLAVLSRHPNLKVEYDRHLDELEAALKKLDAQPTDAAIAEQVGQYLGWFGRMQRQAKLIRVVRAAYFYDNFTARLSARMVTHGINEPVNETIDISDNIMGTSIYGTAETTGQVVSQLLPGEDHVRLQLALDAEALSDNVGYNRSVTIWSTGVTTLAASKEIRIHPTGFETLPAEAEAATSTNVYALAAPSCFVEKLAWRRVGKTKGQAEIVASQRAAARLAEQMDERVEEMLAEPREGFQERFREPLLRRGEWPAKFSLTSTESAVRVAIEQANLRQAAAGTQPPALDEKHDVAVRLHETFVSNFSRAMIGGVTLTDERLVEILQRAKLEIPEELKTSADKAPWSITFSATKPISASFRNGKVELAVIGRRFRQGSSVVDGPIRLSATYTIERTVEGAKLTREGDVVVKFTRLKRLGPDEIALRTVMRAKFEALFKPEFETTGIKLPGRWKDAGILKLATLEPQDGWLVLDWILQSPGDEQVDKNVAVARLEK